VSDPTSEPVDYDPFWLEATGGVPFTQDDYARIGAKLAQTWPVRTAQAAWSWPAPVGWSGLNVSA
jgi:hypothetical protein